MSDSKGSCEAGQTPTTKSSDGSGTLQLASTGRPNNNLQNVYIWNVQVIDEAFKKSKSDLNLTH